MRIDARKSIAALVALVTAAFGAAFIVVAAALPRRGGEVELPGLGASVAIELDARAIPRIRAASLEDALRGQGFMHAQERFFQMDLQRRSAAGELAEIFGERALAFDRAQRLFRYRARSRALAAALPPLHAAWLQAYVEGVNAGLSDLRARPPEYWILGRAPEPWTIEDSVLVIFALTTMLSNNESYERAQGVMHAVLPASVYELLTPSTSRFDRPLIEAEDDRSGGYSPAPIPPSADLDLRQSPAPKLPAQPATWIDPPHVGAASNQWAVDRTRGAGGAAILGNDPHLNLRVPNVLYRCELYFTDRVARGVGVPGVPGVLLGATDTLAWGATVSNVDQSDWVVVESDPSDPTRYRTPQGYEPFGVPAEDIAVAGALAEKLEVRTTRWGPVVGRDWLGRPLALHASWLVPGGLDLGILELMLARDVREGVAVLQRWAGPSMSWMLADSSGEIGWTVNGPLPEREGFDGSRPTSWADGSAGWRGAHPPPTLLGRPDGTLFAANNRTLPLEQALRLSRMWMRPFRAKRVEDLLAERRTFAERDFLAMQLDTRAEAYDAIRDLVLEVVPEDETDPPLSRARAQVRDWNGRADPEQVGFRILHVYYRALLERLLAPLLAAAREEDPAFVYRWPLADESLRRLLDERPAHLLPPELADWPRGLRRILLDALVVIETDGNRAGVDAAWGTANSLEVGHPLAALPIVGRWLRWPKVPQPGSMVSLRVAAPDYGALIRMAVAPARPADGVLQMSGGQSGHFLSAHFGDLQSDWLDGTPTPFLAGPTVSQITLRPPPPKKGSD